MPAYKRKGSKSGRSTKYARTSGTYRSTSTKMLAARKGARLGYRKGGYKARRVVGPTGISKYVDTVNTSYPCNTTGNIVIIPTIGQGPDEIQRLGRNIMLKSLQIRGELQANSSGVQAMARVLIVYDRQPNKVIATVGDIISPATIYGMKNLDNQDRFVILMDKLYSVVGSASTTTVESSQRAINKYMKLGNLLTNYITGTAGTIAEITTGALLIFTLGDMAAGVTAPNYAVTFRTRFQDC